MPIRILLADDHKITRDGLRALIERDSNMKIIGEAETGRQAVRLVLRLMPDVVVMDISMPDLNGIDATVQIKAEYPAARVIALSMYSDRRYVAGMLDAGVSGYLVKSCAYDELSDAIEAVSSGRTYISFRIAGFKSIDANRKNTDSAAGGISTLTRREREVLQLIAEGLTTRKIAGRLHVSIKTVESHRQQIASKLDVHNVAGLTKIALKEGLTSLDA